MHYYQHHIGDFIKATARLSDSQCMAYLRLIWMYYDSEKPLKADARLLAFQVGAPEQDVELILQSFFSLQEDGWHQTRCDQEIADYHAYLEKKANAGRASAERRKNNSATGVQQMLSESSTVEQPNHKPLTTNQQPENQEPKVKRQQAIACPSDVDQQVWGDWVQLRKTKRATVTQTVIDGARNEAEKAGMSLSEFLAVWCRRGSQGLEASWLKPNERQKPIADKYDWLRSDTQVIDME
jgi:uncharacterized protein YdaU (DUF1376 family)